MSIYVDSSAFIAYLVSDDTNHASAVNIWNKLLDSEAIEADK